MVIKSK